MSNILQKYGTKSQCTADSALAKSGVKLAHIDQNSYYGAREASLSFEELLQWQASPGPAFSSFSRSGDSIEQPRAYSLSLAPSLIPSNGPLIDALVASGVSRYGGFRLIERVCVYDPSGIVKPVPGSKEDIFKNKEISLVDKRRLMRFLMFAADNFEDKTELEGYADSPFPEFLKSAFSLNDEMTNAITYALAFCLSPTGRHVSRPQSLSYLFRPHFARPTQASAVPSLCWPLWRVAISYRPLWQRRRNRTRFLPHRRCQWRCIYSR